MTSDTPELTWLDGDVPRAERFNDTYFSRAGGLAETRHVFLKGNGLPELFSGRDTFTIAELGFGTGLNFLTTTDALQNIQNPPRLQFVSVELYPMTRSQLTRALSVFQELETPAQHLAGQWGPKPGWNRLSVSGVDLLLGIGEAKHLLGELGSANSEAGDSGVTVPPVDAWYLDGFSPAKNPDLWQLDLLRTVASLTAPGGTLATYTAAGWVRRNLEAAGFHVEKTRGFAGKREMVVGFKP